MPELPEVETVRRQLAKVLLGRTIEEVKCGPPSYFFVTNPRKLQKELTRKKVIDLERRGKLMIALLSDESRLLLHLGMTGQLVTRQLPEDGHLHLVLRLSGRKVVSFRDVRKFGKVEWIPKGKSSKRLDKLGPDALTVDDKYLYEQFRRRRIAIKSALLNQQVLAGVGNIYADEALFHARVRPTALSYRLTRKQVERIAHEVKTVLRRAVKAGGSTINDYLQPDGALGGFQDWHQVYGKGGHPCPQCRAPIVRLVLGGRSTHFCGTCQS
jgi:formamidopyrimidine-DNA glycosylase